MSRSELKAIMIAIIVSHNILDVAEALKVVEEILRKAGSTNQYGG